MFLFLWRGLKVLHAWRYQEKEPNLPIRFGSSSALQVAKAVALFSLYYEIY